MCYCIGDGDQGKDKDDIDDEDPNNQVNSLYEQGQNLVLEDLNIV